jgi:hypothetical protein
MCGWFRTSRSVAGQTSSWRAHIVIVVEPWVAPRDLPCCANLNGFRGKRPVWNEWDRER